MKCVLLLFAIVFSQIMAQAQEGNSAPPPFREMLTAAATDTQKLNVYRKIFSFYKDANADSARYFMEHGVEAFTASGYQRGKAALLGMVSVIYGEMGDVDGAQRVADESMRLYTELKDDQGLAKIHNSLGVLEGKKGNLDAAVRHFLSALPYFERTHDTSNIINTYIKLGTANSLAGNDPEALSYYKKGLALSLRTKLSANRSYLYNNIGSYYAEKHQFKAALPYLEKALEVAMRPEFIQARVPALMNIGNLHAELNDHTKALDYYNKALALARSTGLKEEEVKLLHSIGALEGLTRKNYTGSLPEALKQAKALGNKSLQVNILKDLARIADSNGNYKEEVAYLREMAILNDSLFSIDKSRAIANLEARYELNKSNTRLAELRISEQKNLEKRNFIIIIAVILGLTLLTLLFFFIRGRKLNRQLSRREQELQNANNIKDKLFSIIGHDLKGPIGYIPSLLEIYRSEDTPEDERQYILDSLEENAQASIETLDNLLNWGKMQIKGHTLDQKTFNVADTIENKLRLFRVPANNKNITIINKVPQDLQVYADENHFRFIMRNLLSNAIKYSRTGGVIEINASRHEDGKYMVFSVKDNGIGIDSEMQRHIFEPYNTSTIGTAEELGNSIGLMLCREFTIQNEGDIWLKSEKGEGTTFYFTMMAAHRERVVY